MKVVFPLLLFTLLFHSTLGQNNSGKDVDFTRLTDELTGLQEDELSYEDLYESYVQLYSSSLDLNKATEEELRLLNILSEKQIQNFLMYRKENESLLTIYELQSIPDFDLGTLHKLIPFVTVSLPNAVERRSLLRRIVQQENAYLLLRHERALNESKGYYEEKYENKFQGSPDKLYLKFRSNKANDFSVGFTAEKDAGEKMEWQPNKHKFGFDYLSYHIQVSNKKKLKNLVFGDFQSQFGQGLLLGGAFGLGKGAETITTTRRCNVGFLPYTSINETGYRRGVASTFEIQKNVLFSAFYSNTKRDGAITTSEKGTVASSFVSSGLHRNEVEISKRKTVGEESYGTIIQFNRPTTEVGVIYQHIKYTAPILKSNLPYNQFAFQGDRNNTIGLFLTYSFRNMNLFTEVAKSLEGGNGMVAGALTSIYNLDLSLLYRKYDRNFYSFYSSAFAESTIPQNESGIYWGWKYKLNRRYALTGFMDLFTFPWLRFRSYSPAHGYEWLVRLNYQPSKHLSFFIQAREETKARNITNANPLYQVAEGTKHNYWFNVDYEPKKNFRLKTRAQFSNFRINDTFTSGSVLLQDIILTLNRFKVSARYALFDTEDYDNRQYVYENNLWLAYSLPAYYGIGIRSYLMLEYQLNKHTTLWLRYARTEYKDKEEIGSGLDKIDGNTENDFKFQILLRF